MRLINKTAIITGAGAGIGRTAALLFADPEDVAYAALYLPSDEAKTTTGQILAVNSGYGVH